MQPNLKMKKRMTLLTKRQGMSTSDFRSYWAGSHAKLALGMQGIAKYVHNRVDKILWPHEGGQVFAIDGIVELYFSSDDAMRIAQASDVGRRFIPADEPNFLKGWTLCVVDTQGEEPRGRAAKVIVPFLGSKEGSEERIAKLLASALSGTDACFALNFTVSTARRENLWSEPNPPEGFVVVWFSSVAAAHAAFDEGSVVRAVLESELSGATAYLIDELIIR